MAFGEHSEAQSGLNSYQPRAPFLKFHNRPERWAAMVCHRRAGKTVACVAELIFSALYTTKPDARFAYLGPLFNQAKDVAWLYLKNMTADILPPVEYNETELRVDFPNGSRIRVYGADNPDRLRGIYLDGIILDEYADMRPSVWGEIVRPLLSDRRGWACFIGTPKGRNDFWKIYDAATRDDDWFTLNLKASESGFIDAKELADARRQMTEDQYNQEYECDFSAAITGAVYGRWMNSLEQMGRIIALEAEPGHPVHTAWDLGYDDATAIWWFQSLHGEIRLLDYYENTHEDIKHYVDVVQSKPYQYGRHYVPHDAAHKLMSARGKSIVQQAMKYGMRTYVISATSQQNQIEAGRKALERCWFDPKCGQGIEALRQYQFAFDEEKKIFKDKPTHDWSSHAADAFEIMALAWKLPVDPIVPEKPRFLEDMTANELFWPAEKTRARERI